ncbi:hypothetical protein X798_07164, partial [Onchocerca flexuosa]
MSFFTDFFDVKLSSYECAFDVFKKVHFKLLSAKASGQYQMVVDCPKLKAPLLLLVVWFMVELWLRH